MGDGCGCGFFEWPHPPHIVVYPHMLACQTLAVDKEREERGGQRERVCVCGYSRTSLIGTKESVLNSDVSSFQRLYANGLFGTVLFMEVSSIQRCPR